MKSVEKKISTCLEDNLRMNMFNNLKIDNNLTQYTLKIIIEEFYLESAYKTAINVHLTNGIG